jgi:hypothetical protein
MGKFRLKLIEGEGVEKVALNIEYSSQFILI